MRRARGQMGGDGETGINVLAKGAGAKGEVIYTCLMICKQGKQLSLIQVR
jgi:hypothetical protein